jgi:type II secretory ATPase GspE/PulE/Tfp pilus assembly ATPase PilB-like protein
MARELSEDTAMVNNETELQSTSPAPIIVEETAQRLADINYATVEGVVVEDRLEMLSQQTGLNIVQLRKTRLVPQVVALLPKRTAVRYNVICIDSQDGQVTVAVADPHNVEAMDTVALLLSGKELKWVLAREDEIKWSIERYYTGEATMVEDMLTEISESSTATGPGTYAEALREIKVDEEGPIKRLVDLIFAEALRMRSSDIHFEPFENKFRIRFRIDGVLHEIQSPDKSLQGPILSRLKLMAGMDLAEKRIPQDGRIQQVVLGRELDFRVSALPALHGESLVCRILEKSGVLLGLEQIGFLEDNIERFKSMIRRPNGIILMTGPTGSGKTTTLYSALNVINSVDTKIVTVENPVEYQIEGINQVQVNDDIGMTFARALRSILRQAPNVILVGEIRDLETAEIAISAAMTGHLVFSTLHTNDAPGANTRLVEMGIKPFLVASAIQAVIAQRLVRTICKECAEPYQADPLVIRNLGLDPGDYKDVTFYRGRGCEACSYTGYKGRTAIHEVMENSDEIRQLVMENAGSDVIRRIARQQGMRTLREDGWKKVLRGTTTMVEVARITAGDEL